VGKLAEWVTGLFGGRSSKKQEEMAQGQQGSSANGDGATGSAVELQQAAQARAGVLHMAALAASSISIAPVRLDSFVRLPASPSPHVPSLPVAVQAGRSSSSSPVVAALHRHAVRQSWCRGAVSCGLLKAASRCSRPLGKTGPGTKGLPVRRFIG
jgi:hypothetical protein